LCKRWIVALVTYVCAGSAIAQSAPTPAQLQLLQSLPASEQQRLAEQFGISMPSSNIANRDATSQQDQGELFPRRMQEQSGSDRRTPFGQRFSDLNPFGYELFASSPSTFAPVGSICSRKLRSRARDRFRILFFGKESADFFSTVDRNGTLAIQDVGRLNVQGFPLKLCGN